MKKEDIVKTINENYREYEGYVQFSHRPIDIEKDVFKDGKKVEMADESGFVYEAHFCNGMESVAIRQVNDNWLKSITDISEVKKEDRQTYFAKGGNVVMAQIWEAKPDTLCEGMPVMELQKVVFAGFAKGGQA